MLHAKHFLPNRNGYLGIQIFDFPSHHLFNQGLLIYFRRFMTVNGLAVPHYQHPVADPVHLFQLWEM